MMKKLLIFLLISISIHSFAQGYNDDKVSFTNFIKRMYSSKSFEGVKIVDDYDHKYLISVITLEKAKYPSESIMNRVAQVKGQSQANTFLNGASISMDMVISTKESKDANNSISTIVETVEQIKQNSLGFVRELELLTTFDNNDKSKQAFIYSKEMK